MLNTFDFDAFRSDLVRITLVAENRAITVTVGDIARWFDAKKLKLEEIDTTEPDCNVVSRILKHKTRTTERESCGGPMSEQSG